MPQIQISSTSDDIYTINLNLPLPITKRQSEEFLIILDSYIFPNNYKNLYQPDPLDRSKVRVFKNFRFVIGKGQTVLPVIYRDMSMDEIAFYSMDSLIQLLLETCKNSLSTIDIENYGPFNLTGGIDNYKGKVYFEVDPNVQNGIVGNYLLEFYDDLDINMVGNVGVLLGFNNMPLIPDYGRQLGNTGPLTDFSSARIFLNVNNISTDVFCNIALSDTQVTSRSQANPINMLTILGTSLYPPYEDVFVEKYKKMKLRVSSDTIQKVNFTWTYSNGIKISPVDRDSLCLLVIDIENI